jgi:hypothetical protein
MQALFLFISLPPACSSQFYNMLLFFSSFSSTPMAEEATREDLGICKVVEGSRSFRVHCIHFFSLGQLFGKDKKKETANR